MKSFSVGRVLTSSVMYKVLLIVLGFLFLFVTTADASVTRKRGTQATALQIEWNIVGGSGTCQGTTDYDDLSDNIYDNWFGNHNNSGSPLTLLLAEQSILETAGTYTFTCTDFGSGQSDSDTLIVTDCLASEYWNGTTCAPNIPRLLICPATSGYTVGNTGNLSALYWSHRASAPSCSDSGSTDVTNSTNWSSTNGSRFSVSNSIGSKGAYSAVSAGNAVVNATYGTTNAPGLAVTVTAAPQPDLVVNGGVAGITLGSGSLTQGMTARFSAQVRNSGSAVTSSGFRNQFSYRWGSSGGFTNAASADRGSLGAGNTHTAENSGDITMSNAGTLQVRYCVDTLSAVTESNEANNCETQSFAVTAAGSVDLRAESLTPANGSTVSGGSNLTITGRIHNDGTANATQAGWADLEIDTNNDGNPDLNYNAYGGSQVGALATGANRNLSYTISAPITPGVYRYRFRVDTTNVSGDANLTNNVSAWRSVTVTNSAPATVDLRAESLSPANGATFSASSNITVTGRIHNDGTANATQAGWADLEIDTNNDGNPDLNYNAYGGSQVGALATGANRNLSYTISAPITPGVYRYRFRVDTTNVSGDSNLTNNVSAWRSVTVTAPVGDCSNQIVSWVVSGNTCSGNTTITSNGNVVVVTSTNGNTGSRNYMCNGGTNTYTGQGAGTCTAANNPPTANAGSDVSITLPATDAFTSGASASDSDGFVASVLWYESSRPSGAPATNITSANTLSPTFRNLTKPGSYIFALEVTDDDGARTSDTMQVTVNPAPTYSCTAPLPVAFASYYTGDDTGLSANTPGSYSAANTGAKCEWVCNTAYWWNGSACVLPDLTAVSTVPANGASFTNLVSIAFTGEARNSATAPVTQGGWADLEIDTDNDGVANMNWNAYPPTYSSRVGSFLQNETKSLSRTLAAGTLAAGSYRYRFHVDTDGAGVAESNESNNTSAWRSFTVTNPVNGVCGPAARTYGFNESAFTGALCSVGSASPAAPAFPAQGATTNWQCLGQFGGSNAACSAPRDNPPPPEVTVGDCTIALEGNTCTRDDVTWNLEAFAGPYNIRNITNSSQISGTASTSAAIPVGAGRRLTLNYGLNTINALAGGSSRASDTANASCNTAAGHFWHSLLGTPVCKAPPSINITAPSVGSGTLVRSGDTVSIEYEVNANYNVACTITGLSGGGPGTYNHVGAPGWVAATPSVTGSLTAAQVIRIDCGVVGIPSSYNSEEIRIDVIPPYQET